MGAAPAAVLAVTTAVPTAAARQPRPLTGRGAASGAVAAIAAGRVDEELFNATGPVRQDYGDTHTSTLPLIATYGTSVARSVPAAPRGAARGLVLDPVDGVALRADKRKAGPGNRPAGPGVTGGGPRPSITPERAASGSLSGPN